MMPSRYMFVSCECVGAGRTACRPGRRLTHWLLLALGSWSQQQVRLRLMTRRDHLFELVAAVTLYMLLTEAKRQAADSRS
jgi:hypothetical protein